MPSGAPELNTASARKGQVMEKDTLIEIEAIKSIVHSINKHWKLKNYEGIGSFLADDVVVAPPGSDEHIRGRAAYVQWRTMQLQERQDSSGKKPADQGVSTQLCKQPLMV